MEERKSILRIRGFIKSIEFIVKFIKEHIKVGDPSTLHGI